MSQRNQEIIRREIPHIKNPSSCDVFVILDVGNDYVKYVCRITKQIHINRLWNHIGEFHGIIHFSLQYIIRYYKDNNKKWVSLYFCFKQMDRVMIDIFRNMIGYYIDYINY